MAAAATEISPKEMRFARYLLEGVNKSLAYTRSGYKASNQRVAIVGAQQVAARPRVQKYLKELQEGLHKRNRMTLEKKLEYLEEIIGTPTNEITGAEPIAQGYNAQGVPTMPCKLKALELHAKLTGDLKDTLRIEADESIIDLFKGA